MNTIKMLLNDFTNECLKLTPEQFSQIKNGIGANTLQALDGLPAKEDFIHFLGKVEKVVKSTGGVLYKKNKAHLIKVGCFHVLYHSSTKSATSARASRLNL